MANHKVKGPDTEVDSEQQTTAADSNILAMLWDEVHSLLQRFGIIVVLSPRCCLFLELFLPCSHRAKMWNRIFSISVMSIKAYEVYKISPIPANFNTFHLKSSFSVNLNQHLQLN